MKAIIRKIIVWKLGFLTRILLARTRLEVIAITGSAGKTTTKEFLASVLSENYTVLAPPEGYNTEIGAPLALFGEKTPDKLSSLWRWILILFRCAFKAIFTRSIAEKVIVEMGADKPGDIKYLCKIFKPSVGIILTVLPVHLTEFKSIQKVAREKAELAKSIPPGGKLILNYDDPAVRKMASKSQADIIYFGTSPKADYQAEGLASGLSGMSFTLKYHKGKEKFQARLYGKHMVYALLAVVAVALEENIPVSKVKKSVSHLQPFKGRMNVLEGVNDSIIIDDSYNANPTSMIEALDFLADQNGRRIALLGNMNELGSFEREAHETVGKRVAKIEVDMLVTVGDVAKKYLGPAAEEAGLAPEKIISFDESLDAGKWLKKKVKAGDIILAKGSQNNVRMENAVEQILKEPKDAKKVLVRQSAFWKNT